MTAPLRFLGLSASIGLFAFGCANVRADYDAEIDFSRYVTYDWLKPPVTESAGASGESDDFDPFADNSLLDKRVRRAVDRQLESQGYQLVAGGSPDFQVQYRVIMSDDTGSGGSRLSYSAAHQRRGHRYQLGALFIDVIDARTQRIAWRGWTSDRNQAGYFTDGQLAESAEEVLSAFPPKGVERSSEETQLRRQVQELEAKLQALEERANEPKTPPEAPSEAGPDP